MFGGYGGLPNEEGRGGVGRERDARADAAGGERGERAEDQNVAEGWREDRVMERTNHVMIVGDGARRLAWRTGSKR